MRVLLVGNDLSFSQTLVDDLKADGFLIERADTGDEALSLLRHYEFDLVLANLSLADMDGMTLISAMRSAKRDTPVLAFTHASDTAIRLRALAAGADDIVHPQIELLELAARMKAIVRRNRGHSQSVLHIGALSLNLEQGTVLANETPVALTQKEFALLSTLMLRKNIILTKDALMNALYGGIDEPEAKIIDVFVCKIRNKFAKAGLHDVIGTVWGRGYIVRGNRDNSDTNHPLVSQPVNRKLAHAHM